MPDSRPGLRRAARLLAAVGAYLVLASFTAREDGAVGASTIDALQRLQAGNDRFVRAVTAGESPLPAAAAAPGTPLAAVLSCADARTAPEIIFSTAPGDLFVVRSLGQVVDRAVVGSLDDACSAVAAATAPHPNALSAHLDFLVKAIRAGLPHRADEQQDVRAAVLANVEQVINDLLGASPPLRAAVEAGRLAVAGAYYESGSGKVVFSAPVGRTTSW
jgi:carbonic anhydrase